MATFTDDYDRPLSLGDIVLCSRPNSYNAFYLIRGFTEKSVLLVRPIHTQRPEGVVYETDYISYAYGLLRFEPEWLTHQDWKAERVKALFELRHKILNGEYK